MMKQYRKSLWLFFLAFCLAGCSNSSPAPVYEPKGEYIFRLHDELFTQVDPMRATKREVYPWEKSVTSHYPKITKEFFRCKGSSLNPVQLVPKEKEVLRFYDCGGTHKHSLPLREGKEFIYPILIELLNAIQDKTGKRVVITCGHCCPDHNVYLNPSAINQTSKHMLGAEVDFYVQGMEELPEKVIAYILNYYKEEPRYRGKKEFEEFKRFEKPLSDVSTKPWYNKEIFIKLFKKHEGRDIDNRHPYPYVSIQVRYDRDTGETVQYSWDKAFRNFHRW